MASLGLDLDTIVKVGIPVLGLAVGWWQRRRIRAQLKRTNEWITSEREKAKEKNQIEEELSENMGKLISAVAGGEVGEIVKDIRILSKTPPGDAPSKVDMASTRQNRSQTKKNEAAPIEEDLCPLCHQRMDGSWLRCHNCDGVVRKECPRCRIPVSTSREKCDCGQVLLPGLGPRGRNG